MFSFTLLSAIIALVYGAPQQHNLFYKLGESRIVGGHDTTINEHPHQVSLRVYGSHICGGSLISENYVVTAAHCAIYDAEDYTVKVGSSSVSTGGKVVNVKKISVNPNYGVPEYSNDIAIFELAESLQLSDTVRPIDLPAADDLLQDGTEVVVTGWGVSDNGTPDQLQAVEVNKINPDVCAKQYVDFGLTITESEVCAQVEGGGKDSCQGDSGGPLIANGKLYGIVSFGYGCGVPGYAGVYGYIPPLRGYITEITGL